MIGKLSRFLEKYQLLVVFLFIILFWVIRLPLFSHTFGWHIWEDGNGLDTSIFVNQPSYPNYSLYGRVDGVELYASIVGHPRLPYEMFSFLGKVVNLVLPLKNLSEEHTISFIKLLVTSSQFLIYCLIGIQLFKNMEEPLKKASSIFLLFLLSCAPISIYNSNEFQIDSFWGFLMIGVFLLTFVNYYRYKKIFPGILLALSSAFIGFGKNEWSIMLVLACLFILFLHIVVQRLIKKDRVEMSFVKTICIILLGNILGNLINYLADPFMYVSGIKLIVQMVTVGTMSGAPSNVAWFDVFLVRIPFISTCIFLILLISLFIRQNRKKINYYYTFLFVYSFFLFFAFFISSWGNYSRYFAPSLIGLIFVFLLYFANYKVKKVNIVGIIVMIFVIGFFGFKQLKDFYTQSEKSEYFNVTYDTSSDCIPLIDVGRVYKKKNVDFIHLSVGYEAAQDIVSSYGKSICK